MENRKQTRRRQRTNPLRYFWLMMLFISMGVCGWQLESQFGFSLPPCEELLAGIEFDTCSWTFKVTEDERQINIKLNMDGQEMAYIELGFVSIAGDTTFAGAPYTEGWIGIIEVHPNLQNIGMGTKLWQLGDRAIRTYFGANQVRIYTNASRNNPQFAFKIQSRVDPVWESGAGDFVYIIQ